MTSTTLSLPGIGDLAAGRYRIKRELGRGGFGVVFLAHQEAIDRHVAIKFLLPEVATDPKEVERFRREVFHASGLQNPHTITLYDYGKSPAGLFYVVMEYLDGITLRDRLNRDGPIGPVQTRLLLEQVLASLDEAHSRELVHRDLKPENIFVQGLEENALHTKVLDFGLSKFIGDPNSTLYRGPSLTADGEICGTPQYMSPEHAYGEPVGPSGDVYSLGLVAYEALVGKPAFDGANALDILLKQVKQPVPDLPEEYAGGILASFIARATKKKAEERFADAGQALDWLYENRAESPDPTQVPAGLLSIEEPGHLAIELDNTAPAVPPSIEAVDQGAQHLEFPTQKSSKAALDNFELRVAQTPLIGRRRTLARLDGWLSHAAHSGGFFLLSGDAGTGKTAVLDTWCSHLTTHQRLQILRGAHTRSAPPLSGLRQAFHALLQLDSESPLRQTHRLEPDRVRILSAIFDQNRPTELESDRSVSNLIYHLVDALTALASQEPILVILEDFQYADPITRRFVDHLLDTMAERDHPIALLLSLRNGDAVKEWKPNGNLPVVHWPLPQLSDDDLSDLLRRVLPSSDGLASGLLKLASGNPALLLHLCRYLLESERLTHRGDRGHWDLDDPSTPIEELVPPDLQQLIIQRAHRYLRNSANESELRAVLHRAVLLGDEFSAELLESCLRAEDLQEIADRSSALLAELTASGLLHQQNGDDHRSQSYTFARPLHRASLARMVESIDDWRGFHELVAKTLIKRGLDSTGKLPESAIAAHLERAGKPESALPWWLRAANRAELEHHHRLALQMLRRAEGYLATQRKADPEVAGILRLQQGRLFRHVGEFGPAEDALAEAIEHAKRCDDAALRARATEARAEVIFLQGRHDEAEELLDEVGDLYHVLSDLKGKHRIRLAHADLAGARGQYHMARQLFEALRVNVAELDEKATEIRCLIGLGRCDYADGNLGHARKSIEKARELAVEVDDRRALAATLIESSHIALFTEGIEAAEGLAHQALTMARREDDILAEANAHLALGLALRRSTHLDRAQFHAGKARELHESLGHIYGLLKSVLLTAELNWAQGNLEEAIVLAEDTARLHGDLGDRHGWALSTMYQSLFLIESQRPDRAHELLADILAIEGRQGLGLYEPSCIFYLGLAHEADGNLKEALAAYGEAQSIAKRKGNREMVSLTTIALVKLRLVLGDVETARQQIPLALSEAQALGHAHANMFALLGASVLARLDRDPTLLREYMTRLRTYIITPNAPEMRLPQRLLQMRRLIEQTPPSPGRSAIAEAVDEVYENLLSS